MKGQERASACKWGGFFSPWKKQSLSWRGGWVAVMIYWGDLILEFGFIVPWRRLMKGWERDFACKWGGFGFSLEELVVVMEMWLVKL